MGGLKKDGQRQQGSPKELMKLSGRNMNREEEHRLISLRQSRIAGLMKDKSPEYLPFVLGHNFTK
jgi:hypothetical protein